MASLVSFFAMYFLASRTIVLHRRQLDLHACANLLQKEAPTMTSDQD
jgi:hypothetical protein